MIVLIKIAQLLLSLSILVLVHEFGHFIAAKIFKVRVEKFYIFFDAGFSLFKRKKGETEYGIGWLPLGGYVKLSGMIDESLDKDQMKAEVKPYEFRSKPAWQRLIIMVAGVVMNIIFAIGIYIVTLSLWGTQYLPTSELKYGITVDSIGYEMGLRNGDKILSVDGKYIENFNQIPSEMLLQTAETVEVERDGVKTEVQIPQDIYGKLIKSNSIGFIGVRVPFEIAEFSDDSPAKEAGMLVNDKLISINGVETQYFDQFKQEVVKYKGQSVPIKVLRNNDSVLLNVNITESGLIGIMAKSPLDMLTIATKKYNIFQAIPAGTVRAFDNISNYFKQLKLIFSPKVKAYESVGGFIAIGKIFPDKWNWESFWNLTAFLSIMLAIINILPIPALDGGHALFALYEIITRRKPSDKFVINAQVVGMIILFALIIFANGNDIIKLIK